MPRLINSTINRSTDANNVSTTGIDTTGAALIVLAVTSGSGVAAPTPTDSESNTWTGLTAQTTGGGNARTQLWYCYNPTTDAAHTFTISTSGGAPAICVMVFEGILTSSDPFDQENGDSTSGASSGDMPTGTITPTENGELIVASLSGSISTGILWAPMGSSVTTEGGMGAIVGYIQMVPGQSFAVGASYGIQNIAGSVEANFFYNPSGIDNACSAIASFKADVVPSGGEHSSVF